MVETKKEKKTFLFKAGFHTKGIIIGAIIFVAAFAWRDLFQEVLSLITPNTSSKLAATLLYTTIVTIVAILLAILLKDTQ